MPRDKNFFDKAYDELIKSFGVYCLSEKRGDTLKWPHYSDAHRGLCLEFDASIPGTLFSEAFKVTYQNGHPIVNLVDLDNREEFRKVILTKSLHWKYEKEWRIVYTEYEGGAGYRPFPPQSLTEVFFGVLMPGADKNKIRQWLKKYPNRVTVYEANISRTKYELDIEESSSSESNSTLLRAICSGYQQNRNLDYSIIKEEGKGRTYSAFLFVLYPPSDRKKILPHFLVDLSNRIIYILLAPSKILFKGEENGLQISVENYCYPGSGRPGQSLPRDRHERIRHRRANSPRY